MVAWKKSNMPGVATRYCCCILASFAAVAIVE